MDLHILSIFCTFLIPTVVTTSSQCQQGINCDLPECFCSTLKHPMDRKYIPQMVYFAFDDAVNFEVSDHYDYLFDRDFKNPNGCPISATLFVSDEYTNYSLVSKFYDLGLELAVHSVTHDHINTGNDVLKEADLQRYNLMTKAGVPKEEIVGWRSPFLVTAGDDQISSLNDLGFTYDISLIYRRQKMNDSDAWPFTLDYGWTYICDSKCPKKSHKGFWQVPINALRDFSDNYACSFIDSCWRTEEADAYRLIMDNFQSHYYGNRSPLGLHIHAVWFNNLKTRRAMERAINDMLKHGDVYILNVKQVLEWMKHPTKLSKIKSFDGWGCWPPRARFSFVILYTMFAIAVIVCAAFLIRRRMLKKLKKVNYIAMKTIDCPQHTFPC